MEIIGGFMMMMSIIGFFLAVVWLIMPFVVFAIKGKQDRLLDVLETVEKRLADIEARLQLIEGCPVQGRGDSVEESARPGGGDSVQELDMPSVSQNSGGLQ